MNTTDFTRMVLGLPHSTADYEGIEAAAALAETLGLDLLAALIEDAGLLGLAGQPYARELRALGAGWQPIDAAQLDQELQRAADAARLRFFDKLRARNVAKQFQVSRGTAAQVITSLVRPTDIVVLFESKHPAERIAQQTTDLAEAAFAAASAVMVVPCRIARGHGPIVALAVGPDDSSVRTAVAIAAAAKEHLIVLNASGRSLAIGDEAFARNVHIEERTIREPVADARNLAAMLASINERILVTPLSPFTHGDLERVASLCGVPVLVVESKHTTTINLGSEH
jgi:hypothetical protein